METSDIYSLVQLSIIGVAVVAAIVGAAISGPMIAGFWYKARRNEMELTLKQSMIERGMTADEIRTVMEAGGEERKQVATGQPMPPPIQDWKQWAHDWKQWAHCWKGRRMRV
jgi:hypothetical protein